MQAPSSRRIDSLDALRGIAALVVVLHHGFKTFRDPPEWIAFSPLRLLFAGNGAVLIFFVLSGFVLFLTFTKKDGRRYFPYIAKRIARIYLPFAVAILLAAALWLIVQPSPIAGLSDWFNHYSWLYRPTAGRIAAHLAMTDQLERQSLDNVMWSLVHEMRISILFPLLALAVLWRWKTALALLLVLSSACFYLFWNHRLSWTYDPVSTGRYLFLFAAGAALCLHRDRVREWVPLIPLPVRLGAWAGGLILVSITEMRGLGLVPTAGAIMLVALSFADRPVDRWLASPVPVWLGRVSYSLYLLHVPILLTLVHWLHGAMPLWTILALALVASLAAAEISYRLVEAPSIRLGRYLAARLGGGTPHDPRASRLAFET